MQPLDDDMDELFRRAADEYPLNTTGGDWNKVMQKLHEKESNLNYEDRKKKDYRYLWLLLLLPIGFICGRYIGNDKKAAGMKPEREAKIAIVPNGTSAPTNSTAAPVLLSDKNSKSASQKSNENSVGDNDAAKSNSHTGRLTYIKEDNNSSGRSGQRSGKASPSSGFVSSGKIVSARDNNFSTQKASGSFSESKAGNTETADNSHSTIPKTSSEIKEKAVEPPISVSGDTSKKNTIIPVTENKATNSLDTKNKKQDEFKRSLSYSLVVAPDLSVVKSKRTTDLGYSIGLLLKYQFSKRLSVEAGAFWDRKNYYAEGKYLDTSKLKLPSHSTVKDASGYCNMIEIPVNFSYNFIHRQYYSWFLSGGLSSYIMKEEDYNVSYLRYGQSYDKDYGYMNSTRNWFSIMNVSVGYQATLGKKTNISIAPYVKLPLRGVGIGKLPITSTGVFLILNRPFR